MTPPRGRPHWARRTVAWAWLAVALASGADSARAGPCVFRTAGPLHLAFGLLDPSRGVIAQQRAAAPRSEDQAAGDCPPSNTLSVRVEGGQHDAANGRLRMRHALRPDAYLRYVVDITPVRQRGPGTGSFLTFQLTGAVDAVDLANAPGGTYSDTLRLSVNP